MIAPVQLDGSVDTALRSLLLAMAPDGVEVVKAQVNRVAVPKAPLFISFNLLNRKRLATNITTYDDPVTYGRGGAGVRNVMSKTQLDYSVDLYGPGSDALAQTVSTLLHDSFATELLAQSGVDVQVIDASDPIQTAWLDGARQIEEHWNLTVMLELNAVTQVPQDFADEFKVQILPPADVTVPVSGSIGVV